MSSSNITTTDSRLMSVLKTVNETTVANDMREVINKTVDENKIRIGKVTKYYPDKDKVEVKIDNLNKTVNCKVLHSLAGNLISLYSPQGEYAYDFNQKEVMIYPRATLNAVVMDICNEDTKDWLLLGYFTTDTTHIPESPEMGGMNITNIGGVNQNSIQFVDGKLQLKVNNVSVPSLETIKDEDENPIFVDMHNDLDKLKKLAIQNLNITFGRYTNDGYSFDRATSIACLNGQSACIKVCDFYNNPVKNLKIGLYINDVCYERRTDDKGCANIQLNRTGTNIINCVVPGNNDYKPAYGTMMYEVT